MLRTEKLRALAKIAGVDVLVAMSPENFVFVSGAYIMTVEMIRPRHAYAVILRDAEPVVLVCTIEETLARHESWIADVRTYVEFKENPIEVLAELLKEKGLTAGMRLGIDLGYLPHASYVRLAERLPGVEIVDTTEVVATMRAVKDEDEVAKVEFAAKMTHQVAVEAMSASRLGETEKTMADRITKGLIDYGADGSLFTVFGSGERTRLAHAIPGDRVPRQSEIIRFDVGGRYGPWMSDFARTYSTGDPTEVQRVMYRNLREVQEETIRFIRPGITAADVFHVCRAAFEKRGMRFHMPHIGHSFGVEIHENPMLRPGDDTVLRPGMVFNIEPFGFDEEGSGYHLEDLIVVTDDGCRILTNGLAPKEIPIIGEPLES